MTIDTYVDFNQKAFIRKVRAFMKANHLSVRVFAKISSIPAGTVFRAFYQPDELKRATLKKFQKILDSYKPQK